MADTTERSCPQCGSRTLRDRCRGAYASHACTWWSCLSCLAYGDTRSNKWVAAK